MPSKLSSIREPVFLLFDAKGLLGIALRVTVCCVGMCLLLAECLLPLPLLISLEVLNVSVLQGAAF